MLLDKAHQRLSGDPPLLYGTAALTSTARYRYYCCCTINSTTLMLDADAHTSTNCRLQGVSK